MVGLQVREINTREENEAVSQLYETAFPEEEQIPWDDLMRLVEEIPLDFTLYYDDEDEFLGFTIMLEREPVSWFWYFAMVEEKRGHGMGREILRLFDEKYKGKTYFMDIESPEQTDAPNPEERRRRTDFYLRNGFRMSDVKWSYYPVDYAILLKGPMNPTQQDFEDMKAELWKHWQPTD